MEEFNRGQQIRYIPNHATGVEDELACEDGFVTSDLGQRGVMCRYWSKVIIGELRTKSCSELTPRHNLVAHTSTTKNRVEQALVNFCLKES